MFSVHFPNWLSNLAPQSAEKSLICRGIVRDVGIDVIVKGNSILFPLKYTEIVIGISSMKQNLGALIVLYPVLLVMPHERLAKTGAREEPIDTPST